MTEPDAKTSARPTIYHRFKGGLENLFEHGEDMPARPFWFGFAGVMVIAAALRFWNLGGPSLWMDEGVTFVWSGLPLNVILFDQIDNHPPLPYIIHHVWQMLFPGPEMGRVPSALAGCATIAAVMLLGRDIISNRAGLIAGLLLALTTGHIYFSQDMRMYTLVVLGLVIAAWGGLGQVTPGKHRKMTYSTLYVIGGALAIYSHLIGLIGMAIIGFGTLVAGYLGMSGWAWARRWVKVNLVLFAVSAPWLFQIPFVTGAFSGIENSTGLMDVQWFLRNMTGFPGLLDWARLFDLALYAMIGLGAVWAWLTGKRGLAFLILGFILVYPLAMIGLHLRQPILVNRVMLPAVIGACLGAGFAIASLKQVYLRYGLIAIFGLAGLVSSGTELKHHVKPENYKAAYAFADANGFQDAAVIVCVRLTMTPAWEYRQNAPVYLYHLGNVTQYHDHTYWNAVRMSLKQYHLSNDRQVDAFLGGGWLVEGGLPEAMTDQHQVLFIRPFCPGANEAAIFSDLEMLGFVIAGEKQLASTLKGETLIEPALTTITLFERRQP